MDAKFVVGDLSPTAAGRGSSLRDPRPKRFLSGYQTLRSRLQTGSCKKRENETRSKGAGIPTLSAHR
jgi:hypothetical protein